MSSATDLTVSSQTNCIYLMTSETPLIRLKTVTKLSKLPTKRLLELLLCTKLCYYCEINTLEYI